MDQKFRLHTRLLPACQDGVVLDAVCHPSSHQLGRTLVHAEACWDEEFAGPVADLTVDSCAGSRR